MSKIERKLLKQFGVNAGTSEIKQFGSRASGNPVETKNIDTIQALSAWESGWLSATLTGKENSKVPTLEDMNALQYVFATQMKYLYQQGIPEWIATETYYTNSLCLGSDGNIYQSLSDNNINNDPTTDTVNWKDIFINFLLDKVYPIGSIYMSVVNTSPASFLGGTWAVWGSGRVPVGVDTGQTEFDTVEKTGGEKTHLLTSAESGLPAHSHGIKRGLFVGEGGQITYDPIGTFDIHPTTLNSELNASTAHNNLQPYITCYMWKRIS